MKIVCVDNYDRESISDELICENIDKHYGKDIVEYLNRKHGDESPHFFRLVEDDYKLYEFQP